MDINSIILIACGAGVIQSVFLSVFILSSRRIQLDERLLLGLLFAISLRLIKSIGWYFFGIEDQVFLNIGFAAHGFIGPILVIYFAKKSRLLQQLGYKIIICIPAIALLVLSPFLTLNKFWYAGGYKFLLYYTVFFLLLATYYLWVIYREKKIYFPWYRNLFIGVAIFCIAYFTNYIFGLNPYIAGPVIYSVVIYLISFIIFTNREIFTPLGDKKKYKNINLTADQIANHGQRISNVMNDQKPYLKSEFSLTELSDLTAIPKHLLSRFFSENLNQSFSDFTNSYRIEKAKQLLQSTSHNNHKIAYIAYECGFNSISSFNAAFRKKVDMSPSEFKRSISD